MPWKSLSQILPSGLAARIIAFLSIALVPIGIISFVQTAQLAKETRLRSQLDLVALTETAASSERAAIVRAGGAALALGAAGGVFRDDMAACRAYMAEFVRKNPAYSFVGLLTPEGTMRCASRANDMDLSGEEGFADLMGAAQSDIHIDPRTPVSDRPVIVVSEPYQVDGAFAGYVSLSLPAANLSFDRSVLAQTDMEDLVLFSKRGQILGSHMGRIEDGGLLPQDADLAQLASAQSFSFAKTSADGTERIFTVTPLVPDVVYAMSIWPRRSTAAQAVAINGFAGLLPLAMWGASVLVAFLAVNRLVIRPIRLLGRRMGRFALTRNISTQWVTASLSQELQDMETAFVQMAESILQDEAAQEDALREKSILLKEVHHRVKNNLQLISSIMNMQIRRSDEAETRAVLMGLQDRVRTLATIYRQLYQTEDLGHVDAAHLLGDVVSEILQPRRDAARSRTYVELNPVELYPDQAVPLSLFVAEALSNALRFSPAPEGRVELRFGPVDEGHARVELCNDLPPDCAAAEACDGLGTRLMRAFAMQLGGELETTRSDGRHSVAVTFAITDFKPEIVDY
ncbi:sensor histidine kinase [Aestuariicoccus sp. MJ-SS9]|uniref:sensor histidine kinase n=1 Tax=Aestuariicoccus sp. MJ-SS9 TaxID=3079855 RepID=UPI002905FA6B|nr:sensor histidine kinase [Aestuariicoccus sp. MJ-SS9]MDU8911974.1 sensor histidine kinase [Aestuariicoccus sp. MJ-SS9]